MGLMPLEEEESLSLSEHPWKKGPVSIKRNEGSHLQARKRALTGAHPCWHLISGFQPPEL